MAKTKEQKRKVVEGLKENLEKQKVMFFIDFQKLKAKDLFDLREKLKETNSLLYVAKKNLIKIAFEEKKTPLDIEELKGQIALVFGFGDEILPAKTIYNFWQEHKGPEILGGFLEGEFIDSEKVIELARLPSKEEILARLVRSVSAPISDLINVLEGNLRSLVYILSSIKS